MLVGVLFILPLGTWGYWVLGVKMGRVQLSDTYRPIRRRLTRRKIHGICEERCRFAFSFLWAVRTCVFFAMGGLRVRKYLPVS